MVKLANAHHKKAGAPILISDKINFTAKNVTWDKSSSQWYTGQFSKKTYFY